MKAFVGPFQQCGIQGNICPLMKEGFHSKEGVSFKCYNPSKPEKYHLKAFKVAYSSNNYLLKFELYVGESNDDNMSDEQLITQKKNDFMVAVIKQLLGTTIEA